MTTVLPGALTANIHASGDSTSFIPLSNLGVELVSEFIAALAIAFVNLFTNILVDLISVFLFFPNPNSIVGLDQLWFSSLAAFVVIWMIAALSWFGTLQVFPYNENLTTWRFVDRSLIAFIAVIISRPALTLVVELVDMIGRYIYPASFGIVASSGNLQTGVGALLGVGILYMTALVILYSVSVGVILAFLGVLSMRALIIYTIYATFPIWMALWIVDEGPLKYGHKVSQVVFRGFAMLLAVGIFVSAILATGGAIAGYTDDVGGVASTHESDSGATIHEQHLDVESQPEAGALSAEEEAEVRNSMVLNIIAIFGSLWGAFGVTTSMLGMMISVGGSAAARSSGRMQRSMPGGGAQTATDKGSPSGTNASTASGTPAGAIPGSHGGGPGEPTGYVSEDDIPTQNSRSIREQAMDAPGAFFDGLQDSIGGAVDSVTSGWDDITTNNDNIEGMAKDAGSRSANSTKDGVERLAKSAGGAIIGGAKAFDSTAEMISTSRNKTFSGGVQNIRDNPIVGNRPDSAEMLEEQGAEFAQNDGVENLDLRFDSDHYYHPDSASGWEEADVDSQEIFEDTDKEIWRGYRTGNGANVIVASATDAQGEAIHMRNNTRYQLEDNTDLQLNSPYAEYDRDAGVVVVNEKQGRSLEELDPHESFERSNDIDSQSYIDEVAASMMTGDERGARGDLLFDDDGKAFNPTVDGANSTLSTKEMERLAEEAAKPGIATKDEIIERVDEATNELYDSKLESEHSTGNPNGDAADSARYFTLDDIYEAGKPESKTLTERRGRFKTNLDNASVIRTRRRY